MEAQFLQPRFLKDNPILIVSITTVKDNSIVAKSWQEFFYYSFLYSIMLAVFQFNNSNITCRNF